MVVEQDLLSRYLGASDIELGLGQNPIFRVFIRDNEYNIIDQLQEWIEFSFISRFNNIGTWNLVIATNSLAASVFRENYGIVVKREVEGVDRVIFSGSIGSGWEETNETITMSGWCDNKLLESTARPTPSLNNGPYPDEYYVVTSIATSVMRNLVHVNIGAAAPSAWKVPQLSIGGVDPLLGGTLTARARFDPLLTLLRELASTPLATGLGFKIQQHDLNNGEIEFTVYEPRDKHIDTVFSTELQTAQDYKRTYVVPSSNYFQVAGGDDFGLNRTVVEGGDEVSIAQVGRRIPLFVDRRGVTDLSELEQELAELIAGSVSSNTIEIIPTDIPAFQYGPDFDLGDYVTAVVRGVSYPRLIREVEVILSPERGISIIPTVSDPYVTGDAAEVRHLNTLQHRLENLETNWNVPNNSLIPDMFHETIRDYVGDLKLTARSAAQPAWLVCDGSAISRSVYSALFLAIGTQFGVGDGSTTFNIPDFRGRMPVGVGNTYTLGELGGSDTLDVSFGSHSHTHSHTHNHSISLTHDHTHASQAHTHPGSHSHSHEHTHPITHAHPFTITGLETGLRNNDSVGAFGFDEPNLSSGTEDHHHNIDTYNSNTDQASNTNSSGASVTSTESDNNAHVASYTGSPSGPSSSAISGTTGSDGTSDSTPASLSVTGLSIKNLFQCVNFTIYAGVEV